MPARPSPREVTKQVQASVAVIARVSSEASLGAAVAELQALCGDHAPVR